MFLASYLLAALAIVLAWPAPVALSRARWSARSPFTAMILWQAIALAGGLSMIGAMLTWGLEPLGDNLLAALRALTGMLVRGEASGRLGIVHIFALSAALLLSVHLVFTLFLTYLRITRQRRRHRELLRLLSSPSPESPGTLVISHPSPVAYCLPGGTRSVTVLSDGLLDILDPQELKAVLVHEQAHLTQRHHLLLLAFEAWRAALPWLPTSRLAQNSVRELTEMLADDVALAQVPANTLVRSIALVATGAAAAPAEGPRPGPTDDDEETPAVVTAHRLSRLLTPRPPLPPAARALVLSGCALLLALPTALLVAPGLLGG